MEQALADPVAAPGLDAESAFESLYRESRDDVFAYLAGVLRDRSAAEEATAVAFERAFRLRRQHDPRRGPARAWLFAIARNAGLDELRRRRRLAELGDEPADPVAADPEDELERSLRRAALYAGIGSLRRSDRELIALKFFGGLSGGEIAAVLGISSGAAAVRLHRAVAKLREVLGDAA